jgi:hypothetical protein
MCSVGQQYQLESGIEILSTFQELVAFTVKSKTLHPHPESGHEPDILLIFTDIFDCVAPCLPCQVSKLPEPSLKVWVAFMTSVS